MRQIRISDDDKGIMMRTTVFHGVMILLLSGFYACTPPEAADSEWVQREVSWWLDHRGPATMHILLTDGEIVWDSTTDTFDSSTTNALPVALRAAQPPAA